jgi:hypothetical protein
VCTVPQPCVRLNKGTRFSQFSSTVSPIGWYSTCVSSPPSTFLRDYAIVFARILPFFICPTSKLILVLFSTNFANISPSFFYDSINKWSSLCLYNYFLLKSERHLGSFFDTIRKIWDKFNSLIPTFYFLSSGWERALPVTKISLLFMFVALKILSIEGTNSVREKKIDIFWVHLPTFSYIISNWKSNWC